VARIILAISFLASAAISTLLLLNLRSTDHPGTVTFVSPPSSDPPFLWIVFDKDPNVASLPLFHNRGHWIVAPPPEGLAAVATQGDRLLFHWDRLELSLLKWQMDRIEYRLEQKSSRRSFSESSALRFWGTLVAMSLGPLLLGSIVALVLSIGYFRSGGSSSPNSRIQ